ncbi:C4-dicarboxylate ABC transporter [Sporanaerobium hydrogeniformans]|uniref:C4-dicarboxylate ABC transporter n=1 Tax=Sporanaerobium hydrogeniformans TaxID=3072179 RepID=A0AC61D9P4_9FIRM|nr:TRAP transporter substrate-binding protein [Sporanaerobium hydrogeniformans]PHV69798.1 C4-dicarboxylate ABC transporter [Sporanaerobium hydrogeniformans]
MKKGIIRLIVCLSIVGLFVSCVGKKQAGVKAPEFVFFYAENQPEDYPTTLGAYKFAELVEERTEGRIKIIVQAESALGYEKDVIKQLQFGGIDFARISLSQLAEVVQLFNVLQMPYLYRNSKHMWEVLDGEIGEDFLDAAEAFDMVGLSWYDAGARNFYNSVRPITSLEDIKGLKIRVQESEVMAHMVEALGATAVPLDYSDVYSGLQQRSIDGAENNWPSYESMDHYEVAKYYTIDEHTRVPELQLCAKATWDKLSLEDQKIIRECAKESALYERKLWVEREKQSEKIAIANGTQVTVLSAEEKAKFQAAVAKVYEKYCIEYMDIIEAIIATGK